MKRNKLSLLYTALCAVILSMISCEDNDGPKPVAPVIPPVTAKGIQQVEDPKFGKILTDHKGMTLYYFSNDNKGASTCTGECLVNWPIYHADTETSNKDIDKSKLGEITRADGKKQSTYKGWPLYYFKEDKAPKEIKGDAANKVWYVAKPDYKLMVVNAQLFANNKNYTSNYTEGTGNTLYLTDDMGRSLYFFGTDKFEKNNFTNADFSNNPNWPIYENETGALPSIIKAEDIKVITVHNKKQLTYKGWPLYYWKDDKNRGDNLGFVIGTLGVTWPIAKVDATVAPK